MRRFLHRFTLFEVHSSFSELVSARTGCAERRSSYWTQIPEQPRHLPWPRLRLSASFTRLPIAVAVPRMTKCVYLWSHLSLQPPLRTGWGVNPQLPRRDGVSHRTLNALTFDRRRMTNQRSGSGAGVQSASPPRHKTALPGEWEQARCKVKSSARFMLGLVWCDSWARLCGKYQIEDYLRVDVT